MSKRCLLSAFSVRLSKSQAFAFALTAAAVCWAGVVSGKEAARLATFQSESGQTSFALSLFPEVEAKTNRSTDVVIMVDTSASQTGVFREGSLAALKTLINGLGDQDRVKLVAVDLDPVELTEGFVSPKSVDLDQAVAALERRVPLGSTDMGGVLAYTQSAFDADSSAARNAVYVGDGVSKGKFLQSDTFGKATESLASSRVAFSSFVIGPERNIPLMAAIANRTGGNLFADSDQPNSAELAALSLIDTVRHAVIWPENVALPNAMTEVFPANVPPLRTDRDTIVVGTMAEAGKFEVSLKGRVNGKVVDLNWPVASEDSSDDFAFLPRLIELARPDQGVSLPTVGSEGLAEVRAQIDLNAGRLAQLGSQALAMGNRDGAQKLADAALAADPNNNEAELLKGALTRAPANSGAGLVLLNNPQDETEKVDDRGRFLEQAESDLDLLNQKTRAEVQAALRAARDQAIEDPRTAIQSLKSLLETINAAADLDADVRLELRDKIVTAVKEAEVKRVSMDEKRAELEQREATRLEAARLQDEASIREERVGQLVKRFSALLDERNFFEASETVVPEIRELGQRLNLIKNIKLEFGDLV